MKNTLLLVANWDSNVGYAWWLMEGFWVELSKNYRCRLAYPSISEIPETIKNSTIQVDQLDFTRRGLRDVLKQCQYLRKHKILSIYFTDQPQWQWRYIAFRIAGVRHIIVHDHSPGIGTPPNKLKFVLKWIVQRLPWHTADAVFAVSFYIKQRAMTVACTPEKRCHVIQNGIPEYSPSTADLYSAFGISRNRKIIVTVARASKYKGIQDALEILSAIDADWHYLHIGDGPDLEEFKSLAIKLKIANRVTFAGRRSDVKDLLPLCYAGLHPSHGEAFSLAILELMQAGLPVLVPDNPSVSAAIDEEVGAKYRTHSEASVILNDWLDAPALVKEMGAKASARVLHQYNLTNTHKMLISTMKKLISD